MELVIKKDKIKDWITELEKNFKVIESKNSSLPIKQYFFPPKEEIFALDKKTNKLTNSDYKDKMLVICNYPGQLEAMNQLDEIMEKPNPDFFYWQKRKRSVLIGIIDNTIEVARGGDLVLEKINKEEYRAWILTSKGRKLINSKFFKKVKNPKIIKYPMEENPFKSMLLDPELLSEAVEWSWKENHKVWDELSKRCLGCGICTYVCPLCHCFSIEDNISLDNSKCFRCRQWDACTLPEFNQIAGGHNFHPTIKERYYNWFYHKFVRAYREYGKAQCVACGNCARNCPAEIKIGKIIKEVIDDYKKSKK